MPLSNKSIKMKANLVIKTFILSSKNYIISQKDELSKMNSSENDYHKELLVLCIVNSRTIVICLVV